MNKLKIWAQKTSFELADKMEQMDEGEIPHEELQRAAYLYLLARISLKLEQSDLFTTYLYQQDTTEVSVATESEPTQPKGPQR